MGILIQLDSRAILNQGYILARFKPLVYKKYIRLNQRVNFP